MQAVVLASATVNLEDYTFTRGSESGRLTPREGALFARLAASAGETVSRAALLQAVWPDERDVSSRVLDATIRRLRKRVEADPQEPRHILTVQGEGYRLALGEASADASAGADDGTVWVDLAHLRISRGTTQLVLSDLEARILAYLHIHRDRGVTRSELLRDVWHYASSTESRAVDKAMFRLRQKLEGDDPSERILVSIRSVGYQLRSEHVRGLDDAIVAPQPIVWAPPVPSSLFGRDPALGRLLEGIAGHRLVVLVGPPGIGKTTLAAAAYHRLAADGNSPVLWVDVREAQGLDDIVRQTALAAGVVVSSQDDAIGKSDELGRALASWERLVVVLDNFEQVAQHARSSLGAWLEHGAVHFVVTSRHALGLESETTLEVEQLAADAAVQIFLERMPRGARIDEEERVIVRHIVDGLDGIPLAIELAAARAGSLPLRTIAEQVRHPLAVLDAGGALFSTLRWSWDLSTERQRDALAGLSRLRGPFDVAIASELLDMEAKVAKETLDELRLQSLIHDSAALGGRGYQLLAIVRDFAEAQLTGRLRRMVEQRMVEVFASDEPLRDLQWLVDSADNLHAAFQMSGTHQERERQNLARSIARVTVGDGVTPLRIDREAGRFLVNAGWYREAITWLMVVRPQLETAADLEGLSAVETYLGWAHVNVGDHVLGLRHLDAALSLAVSLGDASREGAILINLAQLHDYAGRREEARNACDRGLAVARRIGDKKVEAGAYLKRAILFQQDGLVQDAEADYERAIALAKEAGAPGTEGAALGNLGNLLRDVGRLDEAQRLYDQAIASHHKAGRLQSESVMRSNLGRLHQIQGHLEQAETRYQQALAMHKTLALRYSVAYTLGYMGELSLQRGRMDEARERLEESVQIAQEHGFRGPETIFRVSLALVHLSAGEAGAARGELEKAQEIHGANGRAHVERTLHELGRLLGGRIEVATESALTLLRSD